MNTKHVVTIGLLVALCLAPLSGSAAELLFDSRAEAHLEQGMTFLNTGKIDGAVSELEESLKIAPSAEAYYYLGYAYYLKAKKSGDSESRRLSRENFDKAYAIDPSFTPQPREGAAQETAQPATEPSPTTAESSSVPSR